MVNVETVIAITSAVAGLLVVVGVIWKVGRFVRRIVHFLDDWMGEPARPGVPERPGALERLMLVEERTAQLTPNGGKHLRDAVDRIEQTLADHIAECRSGTDSPPSA